MTKNSGSGSSSSGSSGTGSGTGGLKSAFFRAVQANMEKRGWRSVDVPGFEWAAVETKHFDLDSLFAMFDADASENLEGAHRRLSRWADEHGGAEIPQTRVAVAVFDYASRKDIDYITRELQAGTRMGKQSMSAVVDLAAGKLFPPVEGAGPGFKRIRINQPVFRQLQDVVETLAPTARAE